MVEITKTKDRVYSLLSKHPHLRDSDDKLIANFWHMEISKHGLTSKDCSAMEFLKLYSNGLLTNPESIRRSRQKLQEEHPELRGEKYNLRHKNQENIKEQLK